MDPEIPALGSLDAIVGLGSLSMDGSIGDLAEFLTTGYGDPTADVDLPAASNFSIDTLPSGPMFYERTAAKDEVPPLEMPSTSGMAPMPFHPTSMTLLPPQLQQQLPQQPAPQQPGQSQEEQPQAGGSGSSNTNTNNRRAQASARLTSAAELSEGEEGEDGTSDGGTAAGKGGKRRRRNRTERQQHLNRLAQQRYRQRKKEKVQELQSSVCTLQEQLDRLTVLEKENGELRTTTAALTAELTAKDAAVKVQAEQLRQVTQLAKSSTERAVAAERALGEANATIESLRGQLRSSTLVGMDPQALSDRLLGIIKQALAEAATGACCGGGAEAGAAGVAAVQMLTSEALVASISRSLTSACRRELVYSGKGAQGGVDAPSAIPVPCC